MCKLSRVLLIIAFATIVGCIETKDEFTVNPDGSGKVIHEITINLEAGSQTTGGRASGEMGGGKTSAEMAGIKPSDPNAQLKNSVREILSKSSGVDAWKDVSYKMTDDGRRYFKGTAYFPDVNSLRIHSPIVSRGIMRLSLTRNESSEIVIEIKAQEQAGAPGAPQTPPPVPAVPEEKLDEFVRQTISQYQQAKPMMQNMFSTLKGEVILHLPGQIKEVSNFQRIDDSNVRIALDGSRLIGIMDRIMQDEARLKEQIRTGKDPLFSGLNEPASYELLFGQRAPIRVVVDSAAKQLFDYGAEVTAARADYKSVLGELGVGGEVSPKAPKKEEPSPEAAVGRIGPPASEEETGMKVVVGGVRLVWLSDYGRGIMPLGQNNGYTLSLIAELPEPAVKVTGGIMEKAASTSGKTLLPENQWERKIKFPKLAKDGRTVIFDVDLLLPDEAATGLEQISGTLEYLTASGSKDVDLGTMDFKVGTKGNVLEATISSIETDPWRNNTTVLGLRLNMPAEELNSAQFYSEEGTELIVQRGGYSSIGNTTTFDFSITGELPPKGRIVLNVYDQLKKNVVPFRISNIALTGMPLQEHSESSMPSGRSTWQSQFLK